MSGIAGELWLAPGVGGPARLCATSDCGRKTRGYAETEDAPRNLVAAARAVRAAVAG